MAVAGGGVQDGQGPNAGAQRRPRIFYGWWIAVAYFLMNFYWSGTLMIGFSALFTPIKEAFGLSAAATTAAVSMRQGAAVIASPIVGAIFDRVGARPLMLGATAFAAGGTLFLAFAHSLWEYFLSSGIGAVGFAIFIAGTGPALMANWFVRRRGLAISIVVAGAGCGAFLVPAVVAVEDGFGWRKTLVAIVIGMVALSVPASLSLRRRPEDYGLRPDNDPPDGMPIRAATPGGVAAAGGGDSTLGEAVASRTFWLLAASFALVAVASSPADLFFIPHLTAEGFSRAAAAWALTAVGIVGLVGTFVAGYLADRMDRRQVLAAVFLVQGVGLVFFAFASSWWHLVPVVALFGFGSRALLPLVSSIIADYFGRAHFGQIQGVVFSVFTAGGIAGQQIGALVDDLAGSFTWVFVAYAALSLVAVAGVLAIRAPGRTVVPPPQMFSGSGPSRVPPSA